MLDMQPCVQDRELAHAQVMSGDKEQGRSAVQHWVATVSHVN